MMLLEEVPDSGILLLTARFKGYKDNFQNDTRIRLGKLPGMIKADEIGLRIKPLSFGLTKTVMEKVTRATGFMQTYTFAGLTPEKYLKLYDAVEKYCLEVEWWGDWKLLIAQGVVKGE